MNHPRNLARGALLAAPLALAVSGAWAQTGSGPTPLTRDSSFNPSIGVILSGTLSNFSEEEAPELAGFQLGHEGARLREGFSLIGTELSFAANIDDKFLGSSVLGIHAEEDGHEVIEVEEAYIQTLPGAGLPAGARIKAGRAFWTFGYLNEHHPHADDFVDRPLPYRTFIDTNYNDDGVELAYVFPTDLFAEVGAGAFRGDDVPFAGSDNGRRAASAFVRLGSDIGSNQSFRIGAYMLDGETTGRSGGHAHEGEGDTHAHEGEGEEHGDEHHVDLLAEGTYSGDTSLYGVDFRYTWAPTGNPRAQELTLQGEYFVRSENGHYDMHIEELHVDDPVTGMETMIEQVDAEAAVDGDSVGWYVQGVYKFSPSWRIGVRYTALEPISEDHVEIDVHDSTGAEVANHEIEYHDDHSPSAVSAMVDWTNSEFGRVRLQWSREELSPDVTDNQVYLQYIMSLGAHAAHAY